MMRAIALATAVCLSAAGALAAPKTYKLDPDHTIVAFLVDHIGFAKMLGRFNEVSGSFVYDEETQTLSNLRVVVETASVDTNHQRRDDHVRNKDFLNVTQYPQMIFEADGGVPESRTEGTVPGTLTLLGQTRPLTLRVTLNKSDVYPFGHSRHTLGISARAAINRSAYGMTYGVAAGMVGDVVDIIIETEAIRQD